VTGESQHPFDAFARSNHERLRWEAYRLCGNWHDADDLVQTLLIKLYLVWGKLHQADRLSAYSRLALQRTYISEHRRARWGREISRSELPELPASVNHAHSAEDRLTLLYALRSLAPRQRAVVLLRYWYDHSIDETARILGCSPGTVSSQTFHALRTLRLALNP